MKINTIEKSNILHIESLRTFMEKTCFHFTTLSLRHYNLIFRVPFSKKTSAQSWLESSIIEPR